MKYGIDVSGYDSRQSIGDKYVYNLPIDWGKARDTGGLSLAAIKAGESLYQDQAFDMNWRGAYGVIPRVAFHFFRSNMNAIAQAVSFLKFLEASGFEDGDRVAIDYETLDGVSPSASLQYAASWLYEVEKRVVLTPLFYTFPSFWRSVGGESATWAKKYLLWLGQWPLDNYILNFPINIFDAAGLANFKNRIETRNLTPQALKPWEGNPAIWQFTSRADTRAVPGHPAVKKVCDYNVIYMDLVNPAPAPQPTPQPVPVPTYPTYKTTLNVYVRSGPTANDPSIAILQKDTLVLVDTVDTINQRSHCTTVNAPTITGWVWTGYLQLVTPAPVPVYKVCPTCQGSGKVLA